MAEIRCAVWMADAWHGKACYRLSLSGSRGAFSTVAGSAAMGRGQVPKSMRDETLAVDIEVGKV